MAQGDKQARLLALLDSHEAHLTHYAARLLGGDVEKARDIVQEAFLRLWKADQAEAWDNAAAWLFTVSRNLAFDVFRKEKRMVSLTGRDLPADDRGEAPPGAELEAKEGLSSILAALGALPASQQEVLRLKFQSGLAYKDIARVTGHSVTNVGVLIHTGLKTLRASLGAESKARPAGTKGGAK